MLQATPFSADGCEKRDRIIYTVHGSCLFVIMWPHQVLPVAMFVVIPLGLMAAHLVTQMVH